MKNPYNPEDLVARFPDWSYADFEHRALQISYQLQQNNVTTLAIWLEDGAHLACALLACWHAKVRSLFLPNFTEESVQWANEIADLWISDTPIGQSRTVLFDEFGTEVDLSKLEKNRPLFDPYNQTELWLKTSGSSGEAKTIVKTAEQMWLSAQVLADSLPFAADNKTTAISTVSIQHIYGLTVHIMMALVEGWIIGRKQQFFPECISVESRKTEKTVLISSPAMLSRIDWQHSRLSEVVGVISSGGALAAEVSTEIRQLLNQPLVEIYGSTETGPIAIRQDIGLWRTMPYSKVGTNEQGALWLEAKWATDRQQTADAVDIYPEGFELLGRIDRIVKIGDKRTSLVSVEQALVKHPWVNDCYIAQHPQHQRLVAWTELSEQGIEVYRTTSRKNVADELKQHLMRTQEKTALPRFWRFTDKLPRNSQSKISRLDFEKICADKKSDHFA